MILAGLVAPNRRPVGWTEGATPRLCAHAITRELFRLSPISPFLNSNLQGSSFETQKSLPESPAEIGVEQNGRNSS